MKLERLDTLIMIRRLGRKDRERHESESHVLKHVFVIHLDDVPVNLGEVHPKRVSQSCSRKGRTSFFLGKK